MYRVCISYLVLLLVHGSGLASAESVTDFLLTVSNESTSLEIFGDTGLNGTIPTEIGNWGQLESLDIRDIDGLTGPIPTEIGNLVRLTRLDIRDNDGLTGPIPTEIGDLDKLSILRMDKNDGLTGTIPTEIGNLGQLTHLDLARNKLSGELPIQLSRLEQLLHATLSNNNFDINCDLDFLEWYITFSEIVEDKYDFSLQCSGQVYPFNLNRQNLISEPSDSIDKSIGVLTGSRNAIVNWTHPNVSQLVEFDYNPINSDSFFIDCENYDDVSSRNTASIIYLHKLVGFEITILKRDEIGFSVVDIRHCIKAGDIEINNSIFQYNFDSLLPATEYEIVIRPFNIDQVNAKYSFIFGPSTATTPFKTNDDVPEVAPVNLKSNAAREDEVQLSWDDSDAGISTGEIIEYEIHSINDGLNYTTAFRQISITGLDEVTEYRYQVRARTSVGGFSNVYSDVISAQTCPQDMKRDDDADCFAIQGSFELSENEALVCAVEVPNVVSGCETEEGLTVQTLDILEGFWRPNVNDFTEIRSCPVPVFCSKERGTESTNARILMNKTEIEPESKQCSLFHRGVYCSSCDDGYVLSGNDGCIECTDDLKENHSGNVIMFILFISFIILCSILYVIAKVFKFSCYCCSSRDSSCHKTCTCCKWKIWTSVWKRIDVKLRILEGFLQVMFAFQSVLYTDAAKSFLNEALGAIANLNPNYLANGFEVDCAIDVNHYLNLLLYTVPHLLLGLLFFVLYRVVAACRETAKEKLLKECFNIFFVISFLIYPGVSKVIFDTFFCEDFDTVDEDTEFVFKRALRADYRLSCSTNADGRIGWLIYAVLMALIFPVGILVIYVYFLWRHKKVRCSVENKVENRVDDVEECNVQGGESVSFGKKNNDAEWVRDLVYPYKRNRYWFEAYELVRKLLQTTFVSFCLLFGTQAASSVALNLSVATLLSLVYLNPYKNYTDFYFAVVTLSSLAFATQLTDWFDNEDCDRACRTERTGDAIGWIVLFDFVAALFFVGLDKLVHWDGFRPDGEEEAAESEVECLRGENDKLLKEKDDLRKENEAKFKDLTDENEKKLKSLKQENERNVQELSKEIGNLNKKIKKYEELVA